MLTITIEERDSYNNATKEFLKIPGTVLALEHSLVSLSKWESKYQVAFLSSENKTEEQTIDYIRFMVTNEDAKLEVIEYLTKVEIDQIQAYISSSESATTFYDMGGARTSGRPQEKITAELVYYWIASYRIDWEVQHWHLNRLFNLIRICSLKQGNGGNKMSKREIAERNAAINAERRAKYSSSG